MIRFIEGEDVFIFRSTESGKILHENEKRCIIDIFLPEVNEIYLAKLDYEENAGYEILKRFTQFSSSIKNFNLKLIVYIFKHHFNCDEVVNELRKDASIDSDSLVIIELLRRYVYDSIDVIRSQLRNVVSSRSCNVSSEEYDDLVANNMLVMHGSYYFLNGITVIGSNNEVLLCIVVKEEDDEE